MLKNYISISEMCPKKREIISFIKRSFIKFLLNLGKKQEYNIIFIKKKKKKVIPKSYGKKKNSIVGKLYMTLRNYDLY